MKNKDNRYHENNMGKNSRKNGKIQPLLKNQFVINLFVFVILSVGIILGIFQYRQYREYAFYNNARMLVADRVQEIEQAFLGNNLTEELQNIKDSTESIDKDTVVVDLDGQILYSEKSGYVVGEFIELNEFMQTDLSYYNDHSETIKVAFVISKDNQTLGFAGFFIEKEAIIGISEAQVVFQIFLAPLVALLVVMLILFLNAAYLRTRIIEPVLEMIDSSRAIIDGNYHVPITSASSSHLMDNDIDVLTYHFELMRDELEEKRAREEKLRTSQKELMSCISHDLKTPITTIKAYGEGLRDGMAKDDAKVKEYAEVIVSKTEILTKMIGDLIEHSNAELNQLSIVMKEQYVKSFFDNTCKELEGVAQHYKMQYNYENTAPDLLFEFDEQRLTQVLANLVDNAIKYGRKNGHIQIKLSYQAAEKILKVIVEDDGNGINAADIPYVFDKFYRGEKSRSTAIPGSGLGLAICKYIVEAHGGELTCESKGHNGTRFIMDFFVK